jgi:hypothetical protein
MSQEAKPAKSEEQAGSKPDEESINGQYGTAHAGRYHGYAGKL